MKEFLDNLALKAPTAKALRAVNKEVAQHFQEISNQDLLIANIKLLMGARNIGVEDLSKAISKHRSYIGRLLAKRFPSFNPSVGTLRDIAFAFRVRPSTLVLLDLRAELDKMIVAIEGGKEENYK